MVLVAMVALSCLTANCNITEAARIDRLALLGVAACARGLPYFQRHLGLHKLLQETQLIRHRTQEVQQAIPQLCWVRNNTGAVLLLS